MSDTAQNPLVEVEWLKQHLNREHLIVLDASMDKVGDAGKREERIIPGALDMQLKALWSQAEAPFPNTMLSPEDFETRARAFGINSDSVLVVYDRYGIYSAARAWWMFRCMGHEAIYLLNGGLPAWIAAGYETEKTTDGNNVPEPSSIQTGNFRARPRIDFFVDADELMAQLNSEDSVVLDARAKARYLGTVEEPRPGLRAGHIPHSKSLPYTDLLKEGKLKSVDELKSAFASLHEEGQEMLMSCGSGITACILALGANLAGYEKVKVYDGSWTEWGSLKHLPIEKG